MKIAKKALACFLVIAMLLTAAPLSGFVGLDLPKTEFGISAEAASTITSYSTGDIIEFGWYPQSQVTATATISALNTAGGEWISYNYYTGTGTWSDGNMIASDYMRYKDVLYGGNKYRGVVFDSYRPICSGYTSSVNDSHQDEYGYFTSTIYWFKYEPIRWRVLDPKTGMVLSEAILDSQAYNNYILSSGTDEYGKGAYWGDAAKTYYANNYEKSNIRQWMNADFYNTAFSAAQQNIIAVTTLDNSACSNSYSAYDSASTNDKIYLLSYDDARNAAYGFSNFSSINRRPQYSAYAKSQGLFVGNGDSHWLLRSAGFRSYYYCGVDYLFGYVNSGQGYRTYYTFGGVRPVLNFNLTSAIFQSDVKDSGNAVGHTHAYTSEITISATHLTTGIRTFTCSCGDTYTEIIEKIPNHAYSPRVIAPTCTMGGYTIYYCACGNTYVADETSPTDHNWNDGVVTRQPTCTEPGSMLLTCLNNTSHTKTKGVPAPGHIPGADATCTEDQICTVCGEVLTPKLGHTPDTVATCTEDQTCTVCGEVLTPKLGHTPGATVMEDKIEATCTVDGSYNMVVYCTACGEKLSTTPYTITAPGHTPGDAATCTEDQTCIVCGEVLTEKLGHRPGAAVMKDKIEANCTVDGSYNMVVYCATCGEKLSTTPYTITAPGHTPGAEATCTEDQTCTVCGEVLIGKLGHTPGTEATCTEDQTCTVCGEVLVGKLGHTPGTEATCTEDQTCAVCGEILVGKLGHTPGAEATCTEDQVCTVCGEVLVGKLGHTSGAAVMEDKIEATCTVDGSYNMVVYCATCGEKLSTTPYTITAPGHTPGAEATCTEDQTCTVCGEVLTEKLGHTSGATATCTEDQTCTVCGEVLIEKLGHDYDTVVTAPTCTKDGFTTYTCSVCGDTYTADETSATGHDWGEWTVKIPATVKNEGEEIRVCATCGEEESRIIDKLELPTELVIYAPCTVAKETEDGYAVVTVGTTVDELLAASNGTDVLNSKGEKVAPETVLATGMQLVIMTDETIIDCMEIAVLGDVNGDGAITSDDARTTLRLAVGLDVLDGAFLAAAKVNPSVTVSANDARSILRASVGLDDPAAWFDKI